MDETWQEARESWRATTGWPHRRTIPRPRKMSVQSEMPEWKKRVIWGDNWQEPNNDPTQQDHYATTSFDTTHVDPEDWW